MGSYPKSAIGEAVCRRYEIHKVSCIHEHILPPLSGPSAMSCIGIIVLLLPYPLVPEGHG